MRTLLLYGGHSVGIKDYVDDLQKNVLKPAVDVVKVPKLGVHNQQSGRSILLDIINQHDPDVVHVQYDNHIFETDSCPYEQLENLVWFIETCDELGKRVVITLHGIHQYMNQDHDWLQKFSMKMLHRYWKSKVIPAWNKCDIIVHNYNHKGTLYNLGCDTNVHVVPSYVKSIVTTRMCPDSDSKIRVVVPGKRSLYKNYDQVFELMSLLPDNYHVYISDQGDVSDGMIADSARRHQVIDRLHLVTFKTNKTDYLNQLKRYDVAVLPYSEDVPSSGSLQDCLSVMLPCLTSDTHSFREFNNRHACIIPCECVVITGNLLIRRVTQDAEYTSTLHDNIKQYHEDQAAANVTQKLYNIYKPPVSEHIKTEGNIVNVFMCCRDNQDTLQHTLDNLLACESHLPDSEFVYNILENDSQDDTPNIIQNFFKTNKGSYSCHVFGNTKWASEPGAGRMRDMARYRNLMKALCSSWDKSQYSFIIDSEIQFDADIMFKQIEYLQQHTDVAMVTPYGTVGTSDVYYDKFAYRDMSNTQDISDVKDRVRSAFAGFVCIRTPVLQRCEWSCVDGDTSEHVPFCDMVRRHGDVAIDREVRVRW